MLQTSVFLDEHGPASAAIRGHSPFLARPRALARTSSSSPAAMMVPFIDGDGVRNGLHGEPAEKITPVFGAFAGRDVDAGWVVDVELAHDGLDVFKVAARRVDADQGQAARIAVLIQPAELRKSFRQGPHHSAQKSEDDDSAAKHCQVNGFPFSQ